MQLKFVKQTEIELFNSSAAGVGTEQTLFQYRGGNVIRSIFSTSLNSLDTIKIQIADQAGNWNTAEEITGVTEFTRTLVGNWSKLRIEKVGVNGLAVIKGII